MRLFDATQHYENKTRDNGESFLSLKDDSPLHDILQNWIRESHNEVLPNDFIYDMCIECLRDFEDVLDCEIATNDGGNEDSIKEELEERFCDSNPSYYHLRRWIVEARGDEWIDKGMEEGLINFDTSKQSVTDLFQNGYWFHRYSIVSMFPVTEILEYLKQDLESEEVTPIT